MNVQDALLVSVYKNHTRELDNYADSAPTIFKSTASGGAILGDYDRLLLSEIVQLDVPI